MDEIQHWMFAVRYFLCSKLRFTHKVDDLDLEVFDSSFWFWQNEPKLSMFQPKGWIVLKRYKLPDPISIPDRGFHLTCRKIWQNVQIRQPNLFSSDPIPRPHRGSRVSHSCRSTSGSWGTLSGNNCFLIDKKQRFLHVLLMCCFYCNSQVVLVSNVN